MLTTNVIRRVYQIKVPNGTGTCFAIDIDDKQYLVTAKHLIECLKADQGIGIFHENQWKHVPLTIVGKCKGEVDVAVLALTKQIAPALPLEASIEGLVWGQDLFFLGFPYAWSGDLGSTNQDYPLPFVKKAILSCIQASPIRCPVPDGHNNPGFSGGPVVFKEQNKKDFKIAAIVSGYRYRKEPIFSGENQLPLEYRYNTGIIVSYGIQHAVDLIKANPVGAKITVQ